MLVGEAALPEEVAAIRSALESTSTVQQVIHLRTLHVGPDELLVAAKIAIRHTETAADIALGIDEAERAVRAAVPTARYIFIEPDLLRNHEVAAAPDIESDAGGQRMDRGDEPGD